MSHHLRIIMRPYWLFSFQHPSPPILGASFMDNLMTVIKSCCAGNDAAGLWEWPSRGCHGSGVVGCLSVSVSVSVCYSTNARWVMIVIVR